MPLLALGRRLMGFKSKRGVNRVYANYVHVFTLKKRRKNFPKRRTVISLALGIIKLETVRFNTAGENFLESLT